MVPVVPVVPVMPPVGRRREPPPPAPHQMRTTEPKPNSEQSTPAMSPRVGRASFRQGGLSEVDSGRVRLPPMRVLDGWP